MAKELRIIKNGWRNFGLPRVVLCPRLFVTLSLLDLGHSPMAAADAGVEADRMEVSRLCDRRL